MDTPFAESCRHLAGCQAASADHPHLLYALSFKLFRYFGARSAPKMSERRAPDSRRLVAPFRSLQSTNSIFLGGLCVDALWKARDSGAEFAPADLCAKPAIPHKSRQIKSPNSGSRTPRNSQKTKNRTQLKSPKNSILRDQKFHRTRSIG
jgi:hypothetical protein